MITADCSLRAVHPLKQPGAASSNNFPRRPGFLRIGPRYNEDFIQVHRWDKNGEMHDLSLYYRVYNPSLMHSLESPPLIVLHGGPSLPSPYLYPIVHHLTSRSIIFYDQVGCGQSSQPQDEQLYSIENAVNDLKELIRALNLNKFHILGHSFGGVVAYEYAKSCLEDWDEAKDGDQQQHECLSLTLSNTPADMELSHTVSSRLLQSIIDEEVMSGIDSNTASNMSVSRIAQERFQKRYECRTENIPDSLVTAIQSRGFIFGPEHVRDYIARPPTHTLLSSSPRAVNSPPTKLLPPVLLIRGEHDFVTEECTSGWRKIFNTDTTLVYREEVMSNCAHYPHLENPQAFCEIIKSQCFINDY